MPSREALELEIESIGHKVRVRALGNQGERSLFHELGPQFTLEQLSAFEQQVRGLAANKQPLREHLGQAQRAYQALFQEQVRDLLQRKHGAAHGQPLLLRLSFTGARSLHGFPWEALCEPETTHQFLGAADDVLLARGVSSMAPGGPWRQSAVRGAVRLLAVSALRDEAHSTLRVALDPSISAGEVEWLPPLSGKHARWSRLMARLKKEPTPHILHFIGHGRLNAEGRPELLFAEEEEGEEGWILAEALADHLKESFHQNLRLIVLEACSGAMPGALASAAEQFVRRGADAVIAHLWEVHADVARYCSTEFYRLLTGAESWGDVAYSLNQTRMRVLTRYQESAEAFSPVLYLRGEESVLFDFKGRKVVPRPDPHEHVLLPPRVYRLLGKPCSLVLGDRWKDEQKVLEVFRQLLHAGLTQRLGLAQPLLSMSALAQRYVQHFGEESLNQQFQRVFSKELLWPAADSLPLVVELARLVPPGIHVTLLRLPVLEFALHEHRPDVTLNVIQPPRNRRGQVTVMRREGRGKAWGLLADPEAIDVEKEITVLRLYRGYLPDESLVYPLLTEDDYFLHIGRLRELRLSSDLVDMMQVRLKRLPALLMGLSMMTWHHRMLLYRLFGERPLPSGSLVVLESGEKERDLWTDSRLFPKEEKDVDILELGLGEPGRDPPPSEMK